MSRSPHIIAHRGFSGRYPENTLIAFREAVDLGVDWLELDVIATKDNVVIVSHDTLADRCTDGTGSLQERTLQEVRQLDAGSWFDPQYARETIPTLTELFDLITGKPVRLAIEIKGDTPESYLRNAELTVRLVKSRRFEQYVVITSFDESCLKAVKSRAPLIATSLDPDKQDGTYTPWELCQQVLSCGANFLQHNHLALDAAIVEEARAHGFGVWAWTVNNVADMRRVADLGAMGIVTDFPDLWESQP